MYSRNALIQCMITITKIVMPNCNINVKLVKNHHHNLPIQMKPVGEFSGIGSRTNTDRR